MLVARKLRPRDRVTVIEPDKGHESPSREGIEVFKKWVGQVLNEEK